MQLRISVYLTIILLWINSVNPQVIYQQTVGLDQFVPPELGCSVNWILDLENCVWCDEMFQQLVPRLTTSHNPLTIYNEKAITTSVIKAANRFDFKGTCFINWFMGTDFKQLAVLLKSHKFSEYRIDDWFFFIDAELSRKQAFMMIWRNSITAEFRQRTVSFVYPRAVLIMLDNDTVNSLHCSIDKRIETFVVSMAKTCYLCPGSDSYFIWNTHNQPANPWKMLNSAGDGNAHEVPLSCCYYIEMFRPDLRIFEEDYFKSFSSTPSVVNRFPFGNYANVIGAAARRHNFTNIVNHENPSLTLFKTYTSLLPTEFTKFKTLVVFSDSNSLTYCRTEYLTEKTDIFSALLSPFDEVTWCILLLLFTLICLVPGICFYRATDMIWLLLGQPPQVKKFGSLIIALFLVLIPIQSSYTNYFTTNAVKPFEKAFINKNQDLIDAGFKFLCISNEEAACLENEYLSYYNESFRKLILDWTSMDQYFLYSYLWSDESNRISVARDKGIRPISRSLKDRTIIQAESYTSGTECHMLSESWNTVTEVFFYTGPLSDALYFTLGGLIQGGFVEFWDSTAKSIEDKNAPWKKA